MKLTNLIFLKSLKSIKNKFNNQRFLQNKSDNNFERIISEENKKDQIKNVNLKKNNVMVEINYGSKKRMESEKKFFSENEQKLKNIIFSKLNQTNQKSVIKEKEPRDFIDIINVDVKFFNSYMQNKLNTKLFKKETYYIKENNNIKIKFNENKNNNTEINKINNVVNDKINRMEIKNNQNVLNNDNHKDEIKVNINEVLLNNKENLLIKNQISVKDNFFIEKQIYDFFKTKVIVNEKFNFEKNTEHKVKINLHPPALGELEINLTYKEDKTLDVKILATNKQTVDILLLKNESLKNEFFLLFDKKGFDFSLNLLIEEKKYNSNEYYPQKNISENDDSIIKEKINIEKVKMDLKNSEKVFYV